MAAVQDFDIIFAGGGTCACVVASRLSAADPSLKILIIETGTHTRDIPTHTHPAQYLLNLFTAGPTVSQHVGRPSSALGGRQPVVQSGKCVGGGASINFMMYTRAAASDYDDWEKLENPGWGSKDLIPLSIKVETYNGKGAPGRNHGTSGPIKISRGGFELGVDRDFLNAAKVYDPDRGHTDDTNDFLTSNKYSYWDVYIDGVSGLRSDTAHTFIYNSNHKNLHVLPMHRVVRVIFDGDRAAGVEYVDNNNRGAVLRAHASRLVVLSAGAFGSVAILERSGIGSKNILNKVGIEQKVDLPGVGENYNDHNLAWSVYRLTDDMVTLDPILRGEKEATQVATEQLLKDGKGIMAHNSIGAAIKLRPNAKELGEIGPEFSKAWQELYADAPDKSIMHLGVGALSLGAFPGAEKGSYVSLLYYNNYPCARGFVHIQSSDPYSQLDFETGYLDDPADVAVLRWAYKHGRELVRRMKSYRGCVASSHPGFDEGSGAVVKDTDSPVTHRTPIVYTKEDDEKIDEFHRARMQTSWHSLGTCAMKPREQGGVVDFNLNVYGVKNLKISDMSIAPSNVGANTYNTALIIAEKAAIIIAKELGLKYE